MAVTKQTYTATATWTAAQLADIFRSAFIDAGLMTEWFDSFLSGSIENRILRVQYDASKTYGTTFYWFMFNTDGAYLHVATGWNASTHVPTGTQYLDYFATTTNATANHWRFSGSLSNTTAADLIRYSSGSHHWFASRQGATRRVFTIQPASHTIQPWLNLDRGFYDGFASTFARVDAYGAGLHFLRGPALRRDLIFGTALNNITSAGQYASSTSDHFSKLTYGAFGNAPNDHTNNAIAPFRVDGLNRSAFGNSIVLPAGFSGTNPAYVSNSTPVFHSMPFTPYSTTTLNSDFGITFHYATNVFGFQDKFVVTAGVEEWETLVFANATVGNGTVPSVAFLARIV
jgi:hypothetical protein